jgi:uncharacterized protein (DUF1786 family)
VCPDGWSPPRYLVTRNRIRLTGQLARPVGSDLHIQLIGVATGLAQAALALARVLDNSRAINQHPAAAKTLATLLDRLRAVSASCGGLELVRTMTDKGGA